MPFPAAKEPPPGTASHRKTVDWLVVALLSILSGLFDFVAIDRKSFWFDEGVSVAIARLDWYNFARILWRREANMALYYVMLRGWLQLGQSEAFIRSLSILPAVATIPLMYWLGRELFDRRVGMLAALLLAVHAYHVRYAQEARGYSLYIFLVTLSITLFCRWLRRPSRRMGAAHIAVSSLSLYAHFYAGLIIAAEWLSLRLLGMEDVPPETQRAFRWIGILVLPAILFAATTGVGPLNWIQRPGGKDIYVYYQHLAGNGGWPLLVQYLAAIAFALQPGWSKGSTGAASRWAIGLLLLWLLLPITATVVVSVLRPMFVARYFVASLPAFILLAAAGICRLHRRWAIAIVVLAFVALSVRGTLAYYRSDFDLDRDDYRAASRYILDHSSAGDAILFHIAMGRMPYEYYRSLYKGPNQPPVVLYPSRGKDIDYRDFMGKPSPELIATIPADHDRVWVMLKNNRGPRGPDPTTQYLEEIFGRAYSRVEEQQFAGVEVRLYRR